AEEPQTRGSRSSQALLGNTATLAGRRGSRNAINAQVGPRSVSASGTTTGNRVPPGSDEPPRTGSGTQRGADEIQRGSFASNAWLALWLIVAVFCVFIGLRANHRAALSDARAAVTRTNITSTTVRQPAYRTREIQDLRKGDTVLAMDPETGKLEKHRILDAFSRTSDHLRILEFLGVDGTSQTLETTDEHPFWSVSASQFVPAGRLATGDQFVGPAGQLQTLAATRREDHPEGVPVYNIEVDGMHTYFVAAHGTRAPPVLVHNKAPKTGATGFSGRRGFELGNHPLQPVRNAPTTINGRRFSGHALDQMQNRGIPPSVVRNAIENGRPFAGNRPNTQGFFDPVNRIRVIINSETGNVVTVIPGGG
ncbi:MAG: polymorphic toxin-type HINT domain-containing protein, partial [Pirellulales bacterium]